MTEWFYNSRNDDLYADLTYAEANIRKATQQPGFPFKPLLPPDGEDCDENGDQCRPLDFNGIIDENVFFTLLAENPRALFGEMKLRVMLMMAYRDQSTLRASQHSRYPKP